MELSRENINHLIDDTEHGEVNIDQLRDIADQLINQKVERRSIHSFLDLGHFPNINSTISEQGLVDPWLTMLIRLIDKSKYSLGYLIYNRSKRYSNKILFQEFTNGQLKRYSYDMIWEELIQVASSLYAIEKTANRQIRIGILTPNCIRGTLIDLSCLSFHYPVIPIPDNATKRDITFIINHSGITHLFIDPVKSTELNIFPTDHNKLNIFPLDELGWQYFLEKGDSIDPLIVLKKIGRVQMDDVATIMYTSGTTGEPKGITFTQKNMMVKRFARALALNEIGPKDSFLAYLPLYHTFGRFLEMQGSIFWGSSYTFAEDSSYEILRKNFLTIKPSVFISVPKRWTQLYETIQGITADRADEPRINRKAIRKVTGGKLKWGLSAAGYLDPDIFQFFQHNDVHLLSGYGMTEATGGITMTPVGDYQVDSVGKILPGIKLKISDEGELLLKGPYVSTHYFGEPLIPSTEGGWFHTGDIFIENDGHFFIKDRKKEIYKNAAGQTLTPQKIENLLSEFDAIQSAFLVGDNLDFNTVLIYPDPEYLNKHIPDKDTIKIRSAISTLIQSVNGFLSPFERIINFAVIPRDFNSDNDELTQKGTYKRKNILANWANVIQPMYAPHQANIESKGKVISFPNWLLKELNIVSQDITWSGRYLKIDSLGKRCKCQWKDEYLLLGDFEYAITKDNLDIESIVLDPTLWLGNNSFVIFFGEILFHLIHFKHSDEVELVVRNSTQPILGDSIEPDENDHILLEDLHIGTTLLLQSQANGLEFFKNVLVQHDIQLKKTGIEILIQMIRDSDLKFSRKIFLFLIPFIHKKQFISSLKIIFNRYQTEKKLRSFNISSSAYETHHIEQLIKELQRLRSEEKLVKTDQMYCRMIMNLLLELVEVHPSQFVHTRHELTCWFMLANTESLQHTAAQCVRTLEKNFKEMIGKVDTHGFDPENNEEYSWVDTVEFDKVISENEKEFLLECIQTLPIIREAIFLLTGYKQVHLGNIPKQGVWITPMNSNLLISQYRILVNLRDGNAYNFIFNHFDKKQSSDLNELIAWQIIKSYGINSVALTNDLLCTYPDKGIIISAYEIKANVSSFLQTHQKEIDDPKLRDRWDMRWLHFGWSALQGYIDHWILMKSEYSIPNVSMKNVIISEYDNATDVRIIHSLFYEPVKSILDFITRLYEQLIIKSEQQFTGLNHVIKWEIVFTCILYSAGKKSGLQLLKLLQEEIDNKEIFDLSGTRIAEYISEVEAYGYLPKPVIFAGLRYQRWIDLNPKASIVAINDILQELYDDYRLHSIYKTHPEIRIRYFLLTCFMDHESQVAKRLFQLASQLHHNEITTSDLEAHIHELANGPHCSEKDAYFLTRLIYQHVDSTNYAELITQVSGKRKLDLAVEIKNNEGKKFTIRPPFKPKEIANFHDLLLENDLPALFNEDHEFLIMLSENKKQAGGVFWKMIDRTTAHLEKIAIQEKYVHTGLGTLLLNEMMERAKKNGATHVTIGFLKTEYFQRFGFKTDESFAGLVKEL